MGELSSESIKERIRAFLLSEFLPGEDPLNLTDDTPLIDSGILDSIATLKMVEFLEGDFDIKLEAHEASPQRFGTIEDIVSLVSEKV
jgi:acyl carrier protein